ncbi:MAG: PorT family protein [Fibromonadales bacterium]|nr:PorT family protein [Fibromonadales bacterium]
MSTKIHFFLLFLIFVAYGQQQRRIAIIGTVDDEEPPLKVSELTQLTNRLRGIATEVLPQKGYAVMTQQSIVAFLGSEEEAIKKCKESSCLAQLGREVNADYVGQGRIGRLGDDYAINFELYDSKSGSLVSSFDGYSKDIYGLLAIVNEKASAMFGKIPGGSGGRGGSPSVPGGVSGWESGSGGYEFSGGKFYVANIATEPAEADLALSFNGEPIPGCAKSPCKVQLPEGNVRIVAALEQYEKMDTIASIKQNNQSINIKLRANFGILEIKPAYSDGIGKYESWDLLIDGNAVASLENRLSPKQYSVKLRHRCYEDISFNVGINKGSYEVIDMADRSVHLKQGGLVLSAERDGEPVSEPVFVDGKQVGETPFSGTVAVCSEIEVGMEREKVAVRLEHKQEIEYTHKLSDNREKQAMKYTHESSNNQVSMKYRYTLQDGSWSEWESKKGNDMQSIKIGARLVAAMHFRNKKSSSNLLGKSYTNLEGMTKDEERFGGHFAAGLTLNIWVFNAMALTSEVSYNFSGYIFCKGVDGRVYMNDRGKEETCSFGSENNFIEVSASYQTIEIPVLLRLGSRENVYFEAGFQWGFPVTSSATVKSGDWFHGDEIKDNFSNFRVKMDQAIVLGVGYRFLEGISFGSRFIYHLEKLDKYATIESPFAIGITAAYDFN